MNGKARSEEWQQYGPVYRVWAGPRPEIVLTTPEDIRTFHTDSDKHGKPLNGNFGWYFGQLLGRCVGLLEFDEWRKMRQVVDPAFKHSSVVNRIDQTNSSAQSFVENLRTFAIEGKNLGVNDRFTIHAATAFMKFPFYFTAEVVYGTMSNEEKNELWVLAEKRLALLPWFFKGGVYRTIYMKYWDRPAYNQLMDFVKHWADFNSRIANIRRKQNREVPIVSYWDEYEKGNIAMEQVTHTLDEMLFANLDVTTHVLTWAITLVADHEAEKDKLRAEIAANNENLEQYIAKTDTHLHRCYYESLRLRPLALFSIGESAETVKNFRGILVKPKTMVLVDTLSINVRNPFWAPDSNRYNPDRFKNIKQTDLRYNLYVFGFGHRKCLGQYLAGHMVKAIMVHLFAQHEVIIKNGRSGKDDYMIDKNTWVPVANVTIELSKLQ
ncbi:cytochrome P450 monooxigenase GliC-like, putative [Talaromyces stipitatus ATCC 10500]|uniref:Cytochrome P450 monooxigenase GliC-like, putative n=1 Tax=Talaromyces stipitatus (strain ATCC 10500 / CBS 375.48 / QM 6759 / NRRL 1006) TaxID=441959 RepID=B8MQ36_TALSN|nr:cytochrome P450 monooxygenase GliC-like, putative [Talaromyces stipitatus ATCC 10500]EED13062.1 cytochrome P450 monooxigenase GliC-like, putative [Talaromyces stipitatus ATCC 10500]